MSEIAPGTRATRRMLGGLDILMDQGLQPTLFAEECSSRPVTRGQRPNDWLED